MLRIIRAACIACCLSLAAGAAQAATCDPATEDKKVAELVSASQNMTEKLLQDVLEGLNRAEQFARQNKMDEACAVMAEIKAMVPK